MPRIKKTEKKVEPVEVNPAEIDLKVEEKVIEKKEKKVKRVLFAIDSFKFDDKIKEAITDPMQIVTVLIKNKYSKANVDEYLKSNDLKLITSFGAQFQNDDFDVAFVEEAMVDFVPENILNKLKK